VTNTLAFQKAQPRRWAFVIWGFAAISIGVIALLEGHISSTWLVALLLPFAPGTIGIYRRIILLLLALLLAWCGTYTIMLAIPLAFIVMGLSRPAVSSFLVLASIAYLYPHAQSIPSFSFLTFPLASFTFLFLPAWAGTIVFFSYIDRLDKIALLFMPIGIAVVIDLAAGHWVEPALFTDPFFRLVIAVLPIIIILRIDKCLNIEQDLVFRTFFLSAFLGAVLIAVIPDSKIENVTFDESHGKWETALASFNPEDFGRSANYTYSLLFERAKRLTGSSAVLMSEADPLPSTNSAFLIKMPSKAFSKKFSLKLENWVGNGGRLIVVADHTDLYDTTQNINSFLRPLFSAEINTDAVYNEIGMPTIPTTSLAGMFVARLDSHENPVPWQTGASIKRLPVNAIELASFGPSFAEPGDYSRPNRFGPFVPNLVNRYYNHSAIISFGHGKGAVGIVLDSTPWSNFSIFQEQHANLFSALIGALSKPIQLSILGWVGLLLALLTILSTFAPLRLITPVGGFFFGVAMAASFSLSSTVLSMPVDGRDFGLRVIVGNGAKLEFLKQILLPGERNFSRIVSSLGKYKLMPLASPPGAEMPHLIEAKRWLLIQPTPDQLPNYSETLAHLKQGGDLTILFAPEQAKSPDIIKWLALFSLRTQRSIGLMVSDSKKTESGSLIGGRSPSLGREMRVITTAISTSMLNNYEFDQYIQTYTLRPTSMPRTSGLFSLGFSADQFTDDVVGEVWEGIYPSSIGRQREQLLAAVLMGKERPELMPESLQRPKTIAAPFLPAFLVAENGATKLSGTFNEMTLEDPVLGKFHHLRDQAHGFVLASCPQEGKLTRCDTRMLSDDMIEWMVSWRTTDSGKIVAIELLHERKLSGLGGTWNIVFGK